MVENDLPPEAPTGTQSAVRRAGRPARRRSDSRGRPEALAPREPLPPAAARQIDPPVEFVLPPPEPAGRSQFSIGDVMIVMIGVAVGLAGGTWMPADVFAAVLGLVTLVGLFLVHVYPPESHLGKLLWATLVLAYIMAVFAALLRPVVM